MLQAGQTLRGSHNHYARAEGNVGSSRCQGGLRRCVRGSDCGFLRGGYLGGTRAAGKWTVQDMATGYLEACKSGDCNEVYRKRIADSQLASGAQFIRREVRFPSLLGFGIVLFSKLYSMMIQNGYKSVISTRRVEY